MNKKNVVNFMAAACALAFCSCIQPDVPVEGNKGKPYLAVKDSTGNPVEELAFTAANETQTLSVESNVEWKISVDAQTGEWLAVTPQNGKDNAVVSLTTQKNTGSDRRSGIITFHAEDVDKIELHINQEYEKQHVPTNQSLMLDAVFNSDGTAYDASPRHIAIHTYPGTSLMTYYNNDTESHIARFFHNPGAYVSSGYYKVDYGKDETFMKGLQDGHSLEVMFMADFVHDGSNEVKMFSGHQAGGTGFLLATSSYGKEITFLPHTGGSYRWARSGIVPERGHYYHVVGVWDKENGEAKIYVNGELKNTVAATGNLAMPAASYRWLGIGVDAGERAEFAWKGEVLIARVYDDVLNEQEVKELWEVADKKLPVSDIYVDDVLFMADCQVAPNSEYAILGKGFLSGDKILLEQVGANGKSVECATTVSGDRLVIILPSDIVSGKYKLILSRNGKYLPLGISSLEVVNNPVSLKAPKTIAHRCFHKNAPQNSMAALKAAQTLGAYGAEIDVYITTDDKLVVNHDGVLNGVSLQNSTYDQVKNLKLNNGENLPTFEAMLAQVKAKPGTKLIIEIKDHERVDREQKAVDEILRLVTENGMDEQVEYISFDFDLCKRIAAAKPHATVGYLAGNIAPADVMKAGINSIDYQFGQFASHPQWVKEAQALGMIVNTWTVNSDGDLMSAIAMGIDYITTDNPDRLMEICDKLF